MMKYTEGIVQDGICIMCNGEKLTIDEVLIKLNSIEKLEEVNAKMLEALKFMVTLFEKTDTEKKEE